MIDKKTRRLADVAAVMLANPDGRHYGYPTSRASGVRSGQLYPILDRMLRDGWIVDGWEGFVDDHPDGPRRRYYTLTALGRERLVGLVVEGEWADVWSEYRRVVFDRLGMDERRARMVVERAVAAAVAARTRVDPDRVAEALKEFILRDEEGHVLAGRRGERTAADLLGCLLRVANDLRMSWAPTVRHDYAVRKFGTAAEDLGADVVGVLAEWASDGVTATVHRLDSGEIEYANFRTPDFSPLRGDTPT